VRLHQSISLSHSLILLNLSSFSFISATRLSRSIAWSHQAQLLSLLSSGTSARLRYSLQPETWTAVCLCRTSVWVPRLLLVTAFTWAETMARTSPGRVMSTSRVVGSGSAPCLHTFPSRPACANAQFAGPVHPTPGCPCSPGAAPVCKRVWLLSHWSWPMLNQSCHSSAAPTFWLGRGGASSLSQCFCCLATAVLLLQEGSLGTNLHSRTLCLHWLCRNMNYEM